jgi:hypothetical protein
MRRGQRSAQRRWGEDGLDGGTANDLLKAVDENDLLLGEAGHDSLESGSAAIRSMAAPASTSSAMTRWRTATTSKPTPSPTWRAGRIGSACRRSTPWKDVLVHFADDSEGPGLILAFGVGTLEASGFDFPSPV